MLAGLTAQRYSMDMVRNENGKVYIEGVRKVTWDSGEMCEFASALVAALASLGDETAYPYVMGVSGVAFRFTLNPGQWDFGNYGVLNIAADPYEPIRHAFEAVGFAHSQVERGSFDEDAAWIIASIERGVPVLAFRVVGPSDCCIITGYDEGGQVLLGWSTYQNIPDDHNIPHDSTGYFRKPGWHDNLPGYILIGEKVSRPPLREIYRDALAWAVRLMRTPQLSGKITGLEGLRAWAGEMTRAEYFPPTDDETLGWRYVSVAVNMTMLRDHCTAEAFLRQAIEDVPEFAPELGQAADCYREVNRLRDSMDDLIGDNFSEKSMQAIKDASVREAYAATILRICAVEEQAVRHFEQLLSRVSLIKE